MRHITVAFTKGRLANYSIDLFEKIGFDMSEMKEKNRKLVFGSQNDKLKFFLAKAGDVPTYVEYGAADIGICGRDILLEEKRNLYEVLNLGFGKCTMVVAGHPEMKEKLYTMHNLRVATKYPQVAADFFKMRKRQTIEIVKLNGSVELGPIVGLSDVIVDIVETGSTLAENGLEVLDTISQISARLVVNRVSMKMEHERIAEIIEKIKNVRCDTNDTSC